MRNDLHTALRQHRSGKLAEAEAGYRRILAVDPGHADALHLLGVIAHQTSRHDEAIQLMRQAIALNPGESIYHGNLGNACKAKGRLDEAIDCYREALRLKPDNHDALGNLGVALQARGEPEAALECYRQALALKPEYVEGHFNAGLALRVLGRADDALESFKITLALRPGFALAHQQMAQVLMGCGRQAEAATHLEEAIKLGLCRADTYLGLGVLQQQLGQLTQAEATYREMLEKYPQSAEALCNLGTTLKDLGRLDEAVSSYRQALACTPEMAAAHYNLANTLQLLGRMEEAAVSYQQAAALRPGWGDAHNNLGNVMLALGRLDAAIEHFGLVLQGTPDASETLNNLGIAYKQAGKPEAAITCYLKAIALRPDYFDAHSNLLFAMCSSPGYTPEEYLAKAKSYGALARQKAVPYTRWDIGSCNDGGRVRIGLVSGDFKNHPVGYFLEHILGGIDRQRFELCAYSSRHQEDGLTARIKPHFVAWRNIAGMRDADAARLIHTDRIAILVDLSGHTAHNRLPLFAWKAAPVQASWLGYFASTGVAEIDYLLADEVSVPESHRSHFTESIWYLPETRLSFAPPDFGGAVARLPAQERGYLTFGCNQALAKINEDVMRTWARILDGLPEARLRIQSKQLVSPRMREELSAQLARAGIDLQRVTLLAPVSREEYLQAYADVDVALDTFPYPGGTTTCEALWMGVPTITLAGETLLARQGASLLRAAGLPEYVVGSADEYVDLALRLAGDLGALADRRMSLRDELRRTALFNGRRFARELESAFQSMWLEYCRINQAETSH